MYVTVVKDEGRVVRLVAPKNVNHGSSLIVKFYFLLSTSLPIHGHHLPGYCHDVNVNDDGGVCK